jgi:hypothetical protein
MIPCMVQLCTVCRIRRCSIATWILTPGESVLFQQSLLSFLCVKFRDREIHYGKHGNSSLSNMYKGTNINISMEEIYAVEYNSSTYQFRVGCARFALNFFRFLAKWSEIGSVSHVYRLITWKMKLYFFASFRLQFFTSLKLSYFRFAVKGRVNLFYAWKETKTFHACLKCFVSLQIFCINSHISSEDTFCSYILWWSQ